MLKQKKIKRAKKNKNNFAEAPQNTMMQKLWALTSLDGRYADRMHVMRSIFSEVALNQKRVWVELKWLGFLAKQKILKHQLPSFAAKDGAVIERLSQAKELLNLATRAKEIEATTRHDVKAVEYSLRERLAQEGVNTSWVAMVHFACTSEDINNICHALMLREFQEYIIEDVVESLLKDIRTLMLKTARMPMLARTHGQAASPTTLGKELAVFFYRLCEAVTPIKQQNFAVKFGGAVGNYHAHDIAIPGVDWIKLGKSFAEDELGFDYALCTTQIEPHDRQAQFFHALIRMNSVLIDACQDIWMYISLGYFKQKKLEGEVGSSTMPHKINPIDFENAEGNLGLANANLEFLARKLPISRLQRDLTDSTLQRNIGFALGLCVQAYESLRVGLGRIEANPQAMEEDLDRHWEVMAEALQSLLRIEGNEDAYEILKKKSRGIAWDKKVYDDTIQELTKKGCKIPKKMMDMSPKDYVGIAEEIVKTVDKECSS